MSDGASNSALIEVQTLNDGNASTDTRYRYQYSNHLGSAALELNENQDLISYEEYYPFGSTSYQMHKNNTEVSQKRYRYNGKEKDNESGLYYYGARYYADWLCRFTTVDPRAHSFPYQSSFVYAANNPITYSDTVSMGTIYDDQMNQTGSTTEQALGWSLSPVELETSFSTTNAAYFMTKNEYKTYSSLWMRIKNM